MAKKKLNATLILFFFIILLDSCTLYSASAQEVSHPSEMTNKKQLNGQRVYENVCIACHSPPGLGGAPAFRSEADWAPRLTQGLETLISHALNGYSGKFGIMPRKGGRPDLSDAEISSAVLYMINQEAED
jgi:cytochrome c5